VDDIQELQDLGAVVGDDGLATGPVVEGEQYEKQQNENLCGLPALETSPRPQRFRGDLQLHYNILTGSIILSMPRGPSVVRMTSATAWQALMLPMILEDGGNAQRAAAK